MNRLIIVAAAMLVSASPALAGDFSGSVGVTNNYVARGTAQNYSGNPALMGNLNYDFDNGVYVGGFVANVDFEEDAFGLQDDPTSVELSGWVGYRHKIADVTLDGSLGSYNYLGDTFVSLDMVEVKLAASKPVGKATITGTVGWTPDYFNVLGSSWWLEAAVSYPVTDKITASAAFGREIISGSGDNYSVPYNPDGYSYSTWNIGATYQVSSNWSVEARYYNTDREDLGTFYSHNPYGDQYAVIVRRSF